MVKINNFSRHPFNTDQTALLKELYTEKANIGLEIGEPKSPFWNNGQEFLDDVIQKNAWTESSCVVPGNILGEALYLLQEMPEGSKFTLLTWINDPQARKDGYFACCGLVAQEYECDNNNGYPTIVVSAPSKYDWVPTVKNKIFGDFVEIPI